MQHAACRLAEGIRALLAQRDVSGFEAGWRRVDLDTLAWQALRAARRDTDPSWAPVLDELDGLLLRLLDRVPSMVRASGRDAERVRTFRLPVIERLQHATAAALVGHRYGPAGLATVAVDRNAPLARRYYAFLTLAEQHPSQHWQTFARYLTPEAHHAFSGAAAEAARYYPDRGAATALVDLFGGVRRDLHLRAFLSPRILESLYVLEDARTLPFFRELLIGGYTAPDPERCEVTCALVMVRRFTGRLEPNAKFADRATSEVRTALDDAEAAFERRRDELHPVVVI